MTFSDPIVFFTLNFKFIRTHKEQYLYFFKFCIKLLYFLLLEQMGTNHTEPEAEEAMDVEAGQFEDAEEDL